MTSNPITGPFTVYPSEDGTFVVHLAADPGVIAKRLGFSGPRHLIAWLSYHADKLNDRPPWVDHEGVMATMIEKYRSMETGQ